MWLVAFFFGLFSQGTKPIPATALESSASTCKSCHPAQYAEWRKSRHSVAYTNDFFQHDYKKTPRQWCINCHSPLTTQQTSTPAAYTLREEGVNCIACHVRGDTVYAKSKRAGSPHNTKAIPSFGSAAYCEGCHQFSFPRFDEAGRFAHYSKEPMQNTVAEFRNSPYANTHTCTDCHGSPSGHLFPGAHDTTLLKQALSLRVCRHKNKLVTNLENIGAGHHVPTGDVHRHILVRAWKSTSPQLMKTAFYGRRFRSTPDGGRTTIWDSTIPPGVTKHWSIAPETLGLASEPINVDVHYLYGSREVYRDFSEPTYATVHRKRLAFTQLPSCSDR